MSAPWLMLGASLLFATMGACVKLASELCPAGEIVFYRGLVGRLVAAVLVRSRGSSPVACIAPGPSPAAAYRVALFGERLLWLAVFGMLLIVAAGLVSTRLGRMPRPASTLSES